MNSGQALITLSAGVVALLLGLWLVARPSRSAILASTIAGIGWVVLYLGLAIVQSSEFEAWVTDLALAIFGAGVAILAYLARSGVRPAATSRAD
jgi:hypothetical protein